MVSVAQAHLTNPAAALTSRPAAAAAPARITPTFAPPAKPAYLIAFTQPVPGRQVNSPFGLRQLPWEEHGRLHEGIDIAANPGEAVHASADGLVERAGTSDSYGRFVEVKHIGGITTLYAHLGAIDAQIAPGVTVKAGQSVGQIGSSGTSTGPHLHFEIRDDQDRAMDPKYFLGQTFATAADLPLSKAKRIPRGVRMAYVSYIPVSKRALMEARADAKAGKAAGMQVATVDGRPRARLEVQPPGVLPQADRKALIARIAANQKAEMALDESPERALDTGAAQKDAAHVDGAGAPS